MKDAVGGLGALAQESRLAVFRLLVRQGPAGLPAGEISRATGIPPTTLSFHLSQLSRAGLVSARRAGRLLFYAADFGTARGLIDFLLENCCEGGCAPPPRRAGRAAKGGLGGEARIAGGKPPSAARRDSLPARIAEGAAREKGRAS